jgi:ketosteroid isomerase-like protein
VRASEDQANVPVAIDTTAPDVAAVLELERNVALVLANEGFDAYASLFHPDYRNWSGGPKTLGRDDFLAGVKAWYDEGNHAVATRMKLAGIETFGDLALSQYELREDFNSGDTFIGRFASLSKREAGHWLLFRTNFTTLYRGRTEAAPEF